MLSYCVYLDLGDAVRALPILTKKPPGIAETPGGLYLPYCFNFLMHPGRGFYLLEGFDINGLKAFVTLLNGELNLLFFA